MITLDQQKWLDHLSDTDKIVIRPYDPKSPKIFGEVKNKIISKIGKVRVLHRGASYLKISGQDEIDIYVPVSPGDFDKYVGKMSKAFGNPGSLYPLVRARFRIKGYKKHIDVFVINKEDKSWVDSEILTKYLMTHKRVLEKYRKLKEEGEGLSTQKYYTEKIIFINKVLKSIKGKICYTSNMKKERFKLKSAVYLIPMKGNKVLLSRRFNTGWMDGKYSLIAGHLDGGETVSDAMIREALEEADIKINKKDMVPVKVIHRMSNDEYVDFFYVIKKWKGTPKIMEPNKCDDLGWFPVNKLPKNTLLYVKKVIEGIGKPPAFFEFGWEK